MKINGLDILAPEAVKSSMPLLAAAYDLGPMPIVNGRLWTDKWAKNPQAILNYR